MILAVVIGVRSKYVDTTSLEILYLTERSYKRASVGHCGIAIIRVLFLFNLALQQDCFSFKDRCSRGMGRGSK